MKKTLIILFLGVFLVNVLMAREFTLPDGRSLEAEIVQYDERLGQVELKRADGKLIKIKPSVFVEEDQDYIDEWIIHSIFKGRHITVECNKKKVGQRKEDGNAHFIRIDSFLYEIEIQNRSATEISGLDVEYKIFYEQEVNDMDKGRVINHEKIENGKLKIKSLGAREKRNFSTKEVELAKYEFNSTEYYVPGGDPQSTKGDIKGMWIRMEYETAGGMKSIKDFFEPSSIEGKYRW